MRSTSDAPTSVSLQTRGFAHVPRWLQAFFRSPMLKAGYGVQPGGTRSMPLDQAFRRGRAGRARRLGVASLFIGVLPAAVLLNYSSASMPSVLIWFSAIALPLCMWLWIRLPFTGVTLTSSHVVATSWWSRRKYERGAVERFRAEPYTGFFFVFGWTVYDGRFESGHLVLEFADGRRRPLGGTVCNRRVAREIAEALNRDLGLDVGAGVGQRRSSRESRARNE